MLFQKVQQIYKRLVNKILSRNLIIDQSRNTFQLKYALNIHSPFEPISALFTITGR